MANSEKRVKEAGKGEYIGFNLYGPAPNRIYGTVLRTIPWINQTGKPLGDDDGTKVFMNSPEHVAAYELSRKLFKTADQGNTFSGDEGKIYAYLWQDKGVYQVSAIWNVYNSVDNKAELVFHPLPRQDANRSGNVVLGNAVYSVLKKAKNLEGGVALQKFMAEPDTQRQLGVIMGRLPTVASVLEDPKLEQLAAFQPVAGAVRTFADILLKEDVKPVPPYAKNPDKVWIAWGDAFGKILQTQRPDPAHARHAPGRRREAHQVGQATPDGPTIVGASLPGLRRSEGVSGAPSPSTDARRMRRAVRRPLAHLALASPPHPGRGGRS